MTQSLTWSGFPALSFLLRLEHTGGSGEEKGNYAQWVRSQLSSFRKKAVGPPRNLASDVTCISSLGKEEE